MIRRLCPATAVFLGLLINAALCHAAGPAVRTLEESISIRPADLARWEPMNGSVPAELVVGKQVPALRLRCRFSGAPEVERASWDQRVELDLSSAAGIEFKIRCRNFDPIQYFAIYFQGKNGWYTGMFFPEHTDRWETIRLLKSDFHIEGDPGGWDKIQTIRISAWKLREEDTEFSVAALQKTGVLGVDARVAVLQRAQGGQGRDNQALAQRLASALTDGGLTCVTLDQGDTTVAELGKAKVAVVPGGAALSDAGAEVLGQYIAAGGKVIALEALPTKVRPALNSSNFVLLPERPAWSDRAAWGRMLIRAAGRLEPDLWRIPAERQIARISETGLFPSFEALTNRLGQLSREKPLAQSALRDGTNLREKALQAFGAREYGRAWEVAAEAAAKVREAYCLAQESEPNEFRAFWCHSGFGVAGRTWDESIRTLKTNGFNAILPNMLWGGAAFYPSKYLPQAKGMEGKPDQVRECLEACRKHGVAMHVWKVNWYLGSPAPPEFKNRMRSEGRLQTDIRGGEKDWLCPSHPANRQLEIDAMVELARNYEINGVHFDYIRYPDTEHCFCERCKQKFQEATGLKVSDWPALLRGPDKTRWHQWRRDNITAVVKAVSEQVRAVRPGTKISAAVFSEWSTDRDNVAQDWKLWCEKGYMDFVCPMDYSTSDRRFENLVKRQKEWVGKTPFYPGIGLSTAGSRFGTDLVIQQILITRKHRTGGFTVFNYSQREADEILPLLGRGITAVLNQ